MNIGDNINRDSSLHKHIRNWGERAGPASPYSFARPLGKSLYLIYDMGYGRLLSNQRFETPRPLPDLTWRRRSHSRSYATNCPNFNLVAIVCEPTYDSDFVSLVLIGLGHYTVDFSQSAFASLGLLGNLSIWPSSIQLSLRSASLG